MQLKSLKTKSEQPNYNQQLPDHMCQRSLPTANSMERDENENCSGGPPPTKWMAWSTGEGRGSLCIHLTDRKEVRQPQLAQSQVPYKTHAAVLGATMFGSAVHAKQWCPSQSHCRMCLHHWIMQECIRQKTQQFHSLPNRTENMFHKAPWQLLAATSCVDTKYWKHAKYLSLGGHLSTLCCINLEEY